MEVIENKINVSNYITKSNLPSSDYVINPYIGCSHACKYCYASFMKRFTGHSEDWGTFIDIKECETPINTKRLIDKNVFSLFVIFFFILPLLIILFYFSY